MDDRTFIVQCLWMADVDKADNTDADIHRLLQNPRKAFYLRVTCR